VDPNYKDTETGNSAIHMACANGNIEILKMLLENGGDVNILNSSKNSPLHWAALNG